MSIEIINIPDLGEAEDVEVIEVCAKAGDHVDSQDPIIVLESDKAAMEIPASVIGKVISIEVSVGDKVTSGSTFLQIEASNDVEKQVENDSFDDKDTQHQTILEESEKIESEETLNAQNKKISRTTVKTINTNVYAGPAVRKLAREFGIDLSLVTPSGPKKRIHFSF